MRFLLSLLHILQTLHKSQQTSLLPPTMADPPLLPPPPPPPPPLPRTSFPMFYYGLVVVATAAIILVLYNLVVVKWCSHLSDQGPAPPPQRTRRRRRPIQAWRIEGSTLHSITTFKYEGDGKGGDSDCAVCLSVFEEGEEIRQMPKCKHYFHAPCIDMWLYSHMDCPLCRSPVDPSLSRPPEESERSREGLLPGAAVFLV